MFKFNVSSYDINKIKNHIATKHSNAIALTQDAFSSIKILMLNLNPYRDNAVEKEKLVELENLFLAKKNSTVSNTQIKQTIHEIEESISNAVINPFAFNTNITEIHSKNSYVEVYIRLHKNDTFEGFMRYKLPECFFQINFDLHFNIQNNLIIKNPLCTLDRNSYLAHLIEKNEKEILNYFLSETQTQNALRVLQSIRLLKHHNSPKQLSVIKKELAKTTITSYTLSETHLEELKALSTLHDINVN